MSIPTYEEFIDGRKLTASQHKRQMKKYEETFGVKLSGGGAIEAVLDDKGEEVPVKRAGRCEKCNCGGFSLKIINRQFIRSCMECGDKKVV